MKLNLLLLAAFCIHLAASLPVETPTDSEDSKLCAEPITIACIETDTNCDKENISNRKKREAICPALIAECVMRQQQCLQVCLYKATENCDEACPVCPSAIYPHFSRIPADPEDSKMPIELEAIEEAQLEDFEGEEESRPLYKRNLIIQGNNETHYYKGFVEPFSNITTIIRLTNIINNTNEINMPTTINNTNVNNIHVFNNKSSETGGQFGMGYTANGPCCFKVQQKSCIKSTSGPRCHHKRSKVCGEQCTSRIIHDRR